MSYQHNTNPQSSNQRAGMSITQDSIPQHDSLTGRPYDVGWYATHRILKFDEILCIQSPAGVFDAGFFPVPTAKQGGPGTLLRDSEVGSESTDDRSMVYRLVQSGAIPDPEPGYKDPTDITSLTAWLLNVLREKLNILLALEKKVRKLHGQDSKFLKNIREPDASLRALVKWAGGPIQSGIKFRNLPDWLLRLQRFDLGKDLLIYDLMVLITETYSRIACLDPTKGTEWKMYHRFKIINFADDPFATPPVILNRRAIIAREGPLNNPPRRSEVPGH